MRTLLLPNFQKENCGKIISDAVSILKSENVEILALDQNIDRLDNMGISFISTKEIGEKSIDFALTVGGDGTIIRAANLLLEHEIPIIGINLGTLGFLAGIEKDELDLLSDVVNGKYEIDERATLHIKVKHPDGKTAEFTAINDIVICKNAFSGIIDMSISCGGIKTAHYRSDGVIISTASGSTAYAMAAGGPIMHPGVKGIAITPICAHSLHARTIILPEYETITINTDANSKRIQAFAVADGLNSEEITEEDVIEVKRYDKNVRFITLGGKSFYSSINNKLMER